MAHFIVDGDDTLWKNDEYYEAATSLAVEYLVGNEKRRERQLRQEIRKLEDFAATAPYSWTIHVALLKKLFKGTMPSSLEREILEQLKKIKKPELYPWSLDLLKVLSKNGDVHLHTRGDRRETYSKMHHTGTHRFFKKVFFTRKAEADWRKVVEGLNAASSDVLVLGDSERYDIAPARKMGLKTIKVNPQSALGTTPLSLVATTNAALLTWQSNTRQPSIQ